MKTPSFSPFEARAALADLSGLSDSLPLQELHCFMQELQKWQEKLNLTGGGAPFTRKGARRGKENPASHGRPHGDPHAPMEAWASFSQTIWERHILDCAQYFETVSNFPGPWLDLGSGAGFPGFIWALLLMKKNAPEHGIGHGLGHGSGASAARGGTESEAATESRPGAGTDAGNIWLCEKSRHKANFLRHVSRETGCFPRIIDSDLARIDLQEWQEIGLVALRALSLKNISDIKWGAHDKKRTYLAYFLGSKQKNELTSFIHRHKLDYIFVESRHNTARPPLPQTHAHPREVGSRNPNQRTKEGLLVTASLWPFLLRSQTKRAVLVKQRLPSI